MIVQECSAVSILYFKIAFFFVSLAFAGLFAFLETAFTALRIFKLRELAVGAKRFARLFESWEKQPQRILITILIANNLAHVTCSVTITDIMQTIFGDTGFGLAIGILTATIMILLFGEILPKSYARMHHLAIIRAFLWFIWPLYHFLYPVVSACLWIADRFASRIGRGGIARCEVISEKEIEFLISYSNKIGVIESKKRAMLQNIFSLGQTLVKEIMIPVTDMIVIDVNSTLMSVMEMFTKYRYTRLPVFEDKEDNVIGIIHLKDVVELLYKKEQKLRRDIIMSVLFVPESKKINQLLYEFLDKHKHMAIAIDEYGSITGLVTLEDILEEIVGEISDEHERVRQHIMPLDYGGWLMDAQVSLEDVEGVLDIKFNVEDSVTLAGFLAEKLQHLPRKGERVFYEEFCFQIQQATLRRVFQVLVFRDQLNRVKQQKTKKGLQC